MVETARPARVPTRIVLASIVGMWLTYFLIATLRGWLVGLELHDALLWRRLVVILASMVVTAGLWPLLRMLDSRALWFKSTAVLLIALPASLLLALINQGVFAAVEEQATAQIGARDGLRIRSDESGNLLVDPIDRNRDGGAQDETTNRPPVVPLPRPAIPTIAQQEQAEAGLTIDAQTRRDIRWRQLTDVALGRYFLLLAWAGLYFALVYGEQARMAERREGAFRRAAKAAELRSLRYQVNPHFLFNTLNSLSALVMTGKGEAAERMIQTLSNFYRHSLAGDPGADLPLEQEMAQQEHYLAIEAVRFPERLLVVIDLPAALAEARVPGMILQPLVENSVRYGVAPVARAVTVRIAAREEQGQLVIEVADDGAGGEGIGDGGGFGIGLANVRDRLAARYGDAATLSSGPQPGGGWIARITLPLDRRA
ncbi:MAG: histidine kinase [Sphingomonadales bacterium]|nr:histidine kinase [Sphingomonadales bacterium]